MTLHRQLLLIGFATLLFSPLTACADAPVNFSREIRPILSENCFSCHGPDEKARQADLRLDQEATSKAISNGTSAIVPGKPEASSLMHRIESVDADEIMPPPDSHKKLTSRQKELLKRWIAQGAAWGNHWSYVPILNSPLPTNAESHPVDAFIHVRLAQDNLMPSPEASKETLIRRVTLDLIGLPPTLEEVDAFVNDSSAKAYDKVVDRLLTSPHYGERMAVDWLDAARYADSNGYQVDRDRELWPWRDWVIRAFNDNMPFDQFTIEQLAGDLLPDATLDQRIATGFHRNHMLNEEGGIIAEEFLAEYTADRVETTAAVWLGQTFNCARCHDHKFDPFTQRDFYAMKAFFHNVPERGVGIYGNPIRQNAPPFLKIPAPEIEAKIAELKLKTETSKSRFAAVVDQSSVGLDAWANRVVTNIVNWEPTELLEASGGAQTPTIDSTTYSVEIGPQTKRAAVTLKTKISNVRATAMRLVCTTTAPTVSLQWNELKVSGKEPLKLRARAGGESMKTTELAKVLDKNRKTVAKVLLKPESPVEAVFEFAEALEGESPTEIDISIEIDGADGPSSWQVFISGSETELIVPSFILLVAKKEPTQRSEAETKQLREFRLTQHPEHQRLSDELESLKKQTTTAEGEIPTTLVMEEMLEPRETFVLMRGAYDKPGEAVRAATPSVLPGLSDGLPLNRLGMAKWLVSPQNPLTARVTVNRLWQQVFGKGIVVTSEDFGSQGALPSHPELLDWLALEFMNNGWDVKHVMKLMVTSATYRQQSNLKITLHDIDPDNHLLARGPRRRLNAELIRDQALAASGLLVRKLGGLSVRPYHPPGLYEQVTAGNGYNVYVPGTGDDLHRRSLYTYWKRSVPNPAMLLFDASFRETCTLRRPSTNTPLQALNLMNDPTYVEAARFIAQRMLRDGGDTIEFRLNHGFRLILARRPRPDEMLVLRGAYEHALTDFGRDEQAAQLLLAVGDAGWDKTLNTIDLAALTTVASTLLNLDETINKD